MARRVVLHLPHTNQIEAMAISEEANTYSFMFDKPHTWDATRKYLSRFVNELRDHAFYVTCRLASDEFYDSTRQMAYFIDAREFGNNRVHLKLKFIRASPFDSNAVFEEEEVPWEAEGF